MSFLLDYMKDPEEEIIAPPAPLVETPFTPPRQAGSFLSQYAPETSPNAIPPTEVAPPQERNWFSKGVDAIAGVDYAGIASDIPKWIGDKESWVEGGKSLKRAGTHGWYQGQVMNARAIEYWKHKVATDSEYYEDGG